MRQNEVNVMIFTLVRQSRTFCKVCGLIDTTQKVRLLIILMLKQHLNYTKPKKTQH